MHHRVLIEPFRIKSVEPIPFIPFEKRRELLENAHYNLFLLPARDVMIDLLTDSGTTAMSARQWGAVMTGDEAYAGSESYYAFPDAVRDIFTLPEVIPVHQGRAAEHLLFSNLCRAGQLVPNNTHFDTTRANLEHLGVEAVDLPLPEAKDCGVYHPFKGNMDVTALATLLEKEHSRVPFVLLTITNNTSGGQPVSLENVTRVKQLASRYDLPL